MKALFLTLFVSILAENVLLISIGRDSDTCVPLPQCQLLNWMWRNRQDIPTDSSESIEKFIQSLNCGLDFCPKENRIKSIDRNILVHGFRRNPVKKNKYQDLIDYRCKPFLRYVN